MFYLKRRPSCSRSLHFWSYWSFWADVTITVRHSFGQGTELVEMHNLNWNRIRTFCFAPKLCDTSIGPQSMCSIIKNDSNLYRNHVITLKGLCILRDTIQFDNCVIFCIFCIITHQGVIYIQPCTHRIFDFQLAGHSC